MFLCLSRISLGDVVKKNVNKSGVVRRKDENGVEHRGWGWGWKVGSNFCHTIGSSKLNVKISNHAKQNFLNIFQYWQSCRCIL